MKLLLILLTMGAFNLAHAVACEVGATETCTDTKTLTISGMIDQFCSLEITATEKASSLDIKGGETEAMVASVVEKSNASYEVSVSSLNGGSLTNSSSLTASAVPYTVSYGESAAVAVSASPEIVKSVVSDVAVTATSEIKVSFAGLGEGAAPGNYTDVLSFTISAL